MHTLVCLDCSFARRDMLVDEAENCQQMNGLSPPDVASYLTETTGVFPRKSMRNRWSLEALKKIITRLHPCATGCLAFRPYSTSKSSDFHYFNGRRQGVAFT